MSGLLIGLIFTVTFLAVGIPALVLLLRAYDRTKMQGFAWLAVALVGWPFLARVISMSLPVLASSLGWGVGMSLFGVLGLNFFLLVSLAETLVGGGLLITALVILNQELGARTPNRQAEPPPLPQR